MTERDDLRCPVCKVEVPEAHSFCVPCGDAFYLDWCQRFPLPGRPTTLAEVIAQREERESHLRALGVRSYRELAGRGRPSYTAADFRAFLAGRTPW